jgi:hypothetical protein
MKINKRQLNSNSKGGCLNLRAMSKVEPITNVDCWITKRVITSIKHAVVLFSNCHANTKRLYGKPLDKECKIEIKRSKYFGQNKKGKHGTWVSR